MLASSWPTLNMHNAPTHMSARSLDLSQVQLVSHSKVKEPPTFRGDDTDTVDVHEWEDMMKNYKEDKCQARAAD